MNGFQEELHALTQEFQRACERVCSSEEVSQLDVDVLRRKMRKMYDFLLSAPYGEQKRIEHHLHEDDNIVIQRIETPVAEEEPAMETREHPIRQLEVRHARRPPQRRPFGRHFQPSAHLGPRDDRQNNPFHKTSLPYLPRNRKLGSLEAWKLGGASEVEARAVALGGDETERCAAITVQAQRAKPSTAKDTKNHKGTQRKSTQGNRRLRRLEPIRGRLPPAGLPG